MTQRAMRLKDKLDAEAVAEPLVFLHREGLFWKVYEYSAMRFNREIHPYKLQKRFIRTVEQEVVILGFPDNKLKDVLAGRVYEEESPSLIRVRVELIGDQEMFHKWKTEIPLAKEESLAGPVRAVDVPAETPSPPPSGRYSLVHGKAEVPVESPPPPPVVPVTSVGQKILNSLQAFRIESSTPLECLLFVSELKRMLYEKPA